MRTIDVVCFKGNSHTCLCSERWPEVVWFQTRSQKVYILFSNEPSYSLLHTRLKRWGKTLVWCLYWSAFLSMCIVQTQLYHNSIYALLWDCRRMCWSRSAVVAAKQVVHVLLFSPVLLSLLSCFCMKWSTGISLTADSIATVFFWTLCHFSSCIATFYWSFLGTYTLLLIKAWPLSRAWPVV